jgi:hypothetical protein
MQEEIYFYNAEFCRRQGPRFTWGVMKGKDLNEANGFPSTTANSCADM